MDCSEVRSLVEPIASREQDASPDAARHLAECVSCAAVLERARQIDALLRHRAAPAAPANFTERLLGRVRGERWRVERYLDLGFNVTVAFGMALVVLGIGLAVERTGLMPVAGEMSGLFLDGVALLTARAADALPAYVGALAVLGTALGIWWWADRRVEF